MSTQTSPQQRKERNGELLTRLGVTVNPTLPLVESEAELALQSPSEVARRAIVLYLVVSVAHGANRETASAWLKDEDLWDAVSPVEKAFLETDKPTEQETINSSWRAESLWTLLWALGKIERLDLPKELCDVEIEQDLMSWVDREESSATFIDTAELRSSAELLDETDLIYRVHWAVVDARLENQEIPAGFDSGVVYERHYALNWLTCYSDNWDEVTTDT